MRITTMVILLLSGSPAAAEAATSVEAQSIARAAIPASNQRSIDKLADDLTAQILTSSERNQADVGCDTRLQACQDVAAKIAKEAAPIIAEASRRDTARLLAIAIDALLTPAERQAAARFYASSAGSKMALATFGLSDFRRLPPEVQTALFAELERPGGLDTAAPSLPALSKRFREMTRGLPRPAMSQASSQEQK